MKRRDFNRLVLGAGVSPVLAKSSLAQMSGEELQTTPSKAVAPSIIIKNSPRTYNQINVPRKYAAGRRRFTIYWTWSYPWEANRDVTELDNRFSTMTEVRRVGWPRYEKPEWSEREFLQGIAGTLELFHLSTVRFQNIVGEATGHPVVVYQRIDQAGQRLPLDDQVLGDADTMMIFGLDHMITEQEDALPHEGAGRASGEPMGLRPARARDQRIAPLTAMRTWIPTDGLPALRRSISTRTCRTML